MARSRAVSLGEALGVAALFVAGAFVFFMHLPTATWTFDEHFYRSFGVSFLHGEFDQAVGVHPYLAVYLIGLAPTVLGDSGAGAARLVPAAAGLATAAVLWLFARRVAGPRAALASAALWIFLPHAAVMADASLAAVKIERFALLDVFMVCFSAGALYAGWRWAENQRWPWALATGLLAGLATASKLSGVLVLVPILANALTFRRGGRRRGAQVIVVAALCPAVLWLSFGEAMLEAPERMQAILDQARLQNAFGHPTLVGGTVYRFAPWWSDAWFMWKGVGPLATTSLCVLALVGATKSPRRLGVYLTLAVAVPFVYLATLYSISLPHYYVIWMAPLTLLAGLGFDWLLQRGRWFVGAAAVLAVPVAVAGTDTVTDVATMKPSDYRLAASHLARAGLDRPRVAIVGYGNVLRAYLPAARIDGRTAARDADAVVIDLVELRTDGDPMGLQRWVTAHRSDYLALYADHLRVFILRRP